MTISDKLKKIKNKKQLEHSSFLSKLEKLLIEKEKNIQLTPNNIYYKNVINDKPRCCG